MKKIWETPLNENDALFTDDLIDDLVEQSVKLTSDDKLTNSIEIISSYMMSANELSKLMKKSLEITTKNIASGIWTLETAIFFQQRVIDDPDSFYYLISK